MALASFSGWEAMATGLEEAAVRIQEQTGKLEEQDRLIAHLRTELEITVTTLTKRDIEVARLNGKLADLSDSRDSVQAASVSLQATNSSLLAKNDALAATIRTSETVALLVAKKAGTGVPTSMPTPPTTPPQANGQRGATDDAGLNEDPQTATLGPEPELLNATRPPARDASCMPRGSDPELLNTTPKKPPPMMAPLATLPSPISHNGGAVHDVADAPRLPEAVHSMYGGDEYGVPTVPTARKMAIQVGGVSAPNLKTFLLGPGKTAFMARFEKGCDDSFNSDDDMGNVTTAQVSLAAVDKLGTPPSPARRAGGPASPSRPSTRDKAKFKRHSPLHPSSTPPHSHSGVDDVSIDQIQTPEAVRPPHSSESMPSAAGMPRPMETSSSSSSSRAPAPVYPVYDALAVDNDLDMGLKPEQLNRPCDDPEPAESLTVAVVAEVAPPAPPSNAEPDVSPSNPEPDVSPSKSWSNRVFKSVKRTLWPGRASAKRVSQSAMHDSSTHLAAVDSSASANGDASVGDMAGPAGPEEKVDIIGFLVDDGCMTHPCMTHPIAKPSLRPADNPRTAISSYFAGTDPMEDPDNGWLMSTKTLGSGSSASPGQLPTRTAHDERLRLRNELKAAESVLEQKVKAMQDVKIRAEAIRSERGASRRAAADARKAADADKAAGAGNSVKPTRRKRAQQQPAWKMALEKEKEEKRAARKVDEDLKAMALREAAEKRTLRKRNKDLRAGKPVAPIRGKSVAPKREVAAPGTRTKTSPRSPPRSTVTGAGNSSVLESPSLPLDPKEEMSPVPALVPAQTAAPAYLAPGPSKLDDITRTVAHSEIELEPALGAASSHVSASPSRPKKPRRSTNI